MTEKGKFEVRSSTSTINRIVFFIVHLVNSPEIFVDEKREENARSQEVSPRFVRRSYTERVIVIFHRVSDKRFCRRERT